MFIQTRGPLAAYLFNDYVLKKCLFRISGPPGARGPGARAPMAPLLIRHCSCIMINRKPIMSVGTIYNDAYFV